MAIRYYIVPIIGTGVPPDARRPKYFMSSTPPDVSNPAIPLLIGASANFMDFGFEPLMLVRADVTPAEDTSLSANADVISVPANIDAIIGANLAAVQSALENVNVPADWVTSDMTYRTVLIWIARLFQLIQRFPYINTSRLFESATLSTQINQLSAEKINTLKTAAQSHGLDISGITGAMTIRQALEILVNQMSLPIMFNNQQL